MKNQPSMEQVKRKYAIWRKTKKNRNSRVPESLRREIISLSKANTVGGVASRLGLSYSMILKWIKSSDLDNKTTSKMKFIEIKPEHIQAPVALTHLKVIDVFRCDGLHLRISGDFTESSLVFVSKSLALEMQKQ